MLDLAIAMWNTGYMEESAQTSNLKTVSPQTLSSHRNIVTVVVVAVIAALLASAGTYYVMNLNKDLESQESSEQITATPVQTKTSNSQPESLEYYLQTINDHSSTEDRLAAYFTYQISFSSKYYATTDDMVKYFRTQGGMGPPRLMLTTNSQLLPINKDKVETWYDQIKELEKSNRDCILVWSTSGFSSFDDWENITGSSYEVVSEETVKPGKHSFIKRVVKDKQINTQKLQAFIQFPEGVSYYLTTCNMKSESDFNTVLQTFDIRGNNF